MKQMHKYDHLFGVKPPRPWPQDYNKDINTLTDCAPPEQPMKQIRKQITVWNQFWSEPKYILRDIILLLAIYGFVRGCMDIWSFFV